MIKKILICVILYFLASSPAW
ncbi:hypothetical protein ESCNG_400005 [Neisseria gonorrhoeae]|nr:hypothetical protein ESCNG_1280005 [Neisseria gonorrhoeae]SCW15841.1 hypothetical protein ESCNG_270027 [Neisseria gonorrhoeae]SCW16184.1 hypothetical protein ESCNG_400005 [Neisseria gonorrhoeae]SCW16614.1 hypothetical protein ESCNG_380011 [Neisseria gonorrhoeae]